MAEQVKRASFESALDGIRNGRMTYAGDLILPMIQKEVDTRLQDFRGLSQAEESALLSLTEA